MLYVTTRNHQDTFTLAHVLTESRGPDGGLYVPLHFPVLSSGDLKKMRTMSFNQRVAEMLNLFFSGKLSGWDVDFSTGRYPVREVCLPYKIIMAETWHNPQWKYDNLEKKLREQVAGQADASGNWVSVAVRMAILGAILLDQEETNEAAADVVSVCDDFSTSISAWYLRKMGFPVGNIICCCHENDPIWDLICLGQMKTELEIPVHLERLISACGGVTETAQYLACCEAGAVYSVSDMLLKELRRGLYVSVVSKTRTETAIPNVFKTHGYVLEPDSALAYSGLMDYRAKTGVARPAVVLCDKSPICDADTVAGCMNLSKEEFLRIF